MSDYSRPQAELREYLREIDDLNHSLAALGWDQQVIMPKDGTAARGRSMATIQRLAHERLTAPKFGELLAAWEAELAENPEAAGEYDAGILRALRRDYEHALRVPSELIGEIAQASADAQPIWQEARSTNNFALFAPALKRNIELRQRLAACFPEVDHPYDALLDQFEPGIKTAEVREVFERLQEGLRPIIEEIAARPAPTPLSGTFAQDAQAQISQEMAVAVGFEPDAWRLDVSTHPFSTKIGPGDLRITTRYDESEPLGGILATLHEAGHSLYEFQVAEELVGTMTDTGTSLGVHESQSRIWENQVGRSSEFWGHWLPRAQELFPEALSDSDLATLLAAVLEVKPSLIRVEADEVTYSMHVVLRFELEVALIEGSLSVEDLPAAWNKRMKELLGVEVDTDSNGVLQDIHWSFGEFGYFPTYALGSIVAGQLWDSALAAVPDLQEQVAAGNLVPMREWLAQNVHRFGRTKTTSEILKYATGSESLDPEPMLRQLRERYLG